MVTLKFEKVIETNTDHRLEYYNLSLNIDDPSWDILNIMINPAKWLWRKLHKTAMK